MTTQRRVGRCVGLLQRHAPVLQLGQWNGVARHGANDIIARRNDLKLAIEIFDLGLAPEAEQAFKTIHRADRGLSFTTEAAGLPASAVARYINVRASASHLARDTLCPRLLAPHHRLLREQRRSNDEYSRSSQD